MGQPWVFLFQTIWMQRIFLHLHSRRVLVAHSFDKVFIEIFKCYESMSVIFYLFYIIQ